MSAVDASNPGSVGVAALLLAAALVTAGGSRSGRGRLRELGAVPSAVDDAPVAALRPAWIAVGATALGVLAGAVGGIAAGAVVCGATGLAGGLAVRLLAGRGRDTGPTPELAAGWELVAVCLEAGLPVASAVSAAAEPLAGPAGTHLRRVAGLLELGADPADAWATAEAVPALAAFARAAGRSAATGAGLAQVARAEGTRIRAALVDSAQARAERAAVLITGPLGLCFLPAFLILGIAPVVIGLAGQALARW